MEFFVILTAWLLLQWLGPSTALHRDEWLYRWYSSATAALGGLPPVARLLLISLLPALLVGLLAQLLKPALGGALLFALELLVLIYALGRGDFNAQLDAYLERWQRGDLEAAYQEALRVGMLPAAPDIEVAPLDDSIALHSEMRMAVAYGGFERWFAVVFWFFVLGPAAALFYRTLQLLSRYVGVEEQQLIARWLLWIEWLPARMLGLAFALTGNFAACFRRWRERLFNLEPTRKLLLDYEERALDGAVAEAQQGGQGYLVAAAVELNELRDLLRRSAVCWLVAFALLQLIG